MTVSDVTALFDSLPGVALRHDATADHEVDGRRPRAVVRPGDADGVSAVLRVAAAHGLSVIPRGGGTQIGLGNVPRALDVVLDLTALDRVIEYRPRDLAITVEAGITLAALQHVVGGHGQLVALDPPRPERATAGGTVAANVTGPRRFRYGTARDLVIGTGAVLADGTAIKAGGRVVKNVAGYDLNKLFVGSAGTLGVITRLTFKLLPAPAERGAVVARFDTAGQAHAAAMRVAGSTLWPLSIDLLDAAAARTVLERDADGWWLVAEAGGPHAVVERTRTELLAIARAAGCRAADDLPGADVEQITARLRDFGHPAEDGPSLALRTAVLPSQVADVCRVIAEVSDEHRAVPAIVARAGNGVVLSLWPTSEPDEIRALVERLRTAVRPLGGIVMVERCPPAAKRDLDVWGIDGPDVALMRQVKEAFDPAGTLSLGRGPLGL